MRIVAIVSLVCALSLATVSAAGQVVAVSSNGDLVTTLSTSELSPAETEVLAADASWARAYQSCDMKLMDKVLHEDLMFIHAHARVDTKSVVMKQFGSCANEETTIDPLRVVVISPNVGVVEAGMKLRQKGRADITQSIYTRVYVREAGGDWRLIAHQTTRNPGVDADGKPMPNPAFQPPSAAPATPADGAR